MSRSIHRITLSLSKGLVLALLAAPLAAHAQPADLLVTRALPPPPGLSMSAAEVRASIPAMRRLPDFRLEALDANTAGGDSLALSDLAGRVVVLNVWASWCGPCRQEMPELDSLARTLGPYGLSVVGVTIDDDRDAARAVATALGVAYPLLFDDGRMTERLGASGVMPVTYVLDRDRRLRLIADGRVSYADLYPTIWALVSP